LVLGRERIGIHLLDRIGKLLRSALPGEQVHAEPDEARSGHAPPAIFNMFHKARFSSTTITPGKFCASVVLG
jgi:hypothetical protein